jgi:uncharacterized membrane protein YgaE (UPF0421/DUF939 family)
MFKIGYRTLKTAIGTALSIWIAQSVGLQNFVSSGILTILCIQVTKKRSLLTAWARFISCIIGILFSYLFFEGIGYHPITIGLLLLVFIPTLVALKAKEGIVTSSVIILHFYLAEDFTLEFVLNELGIIVIGIGVALILNLYMPSMENTLKLYQQQIEDYFRIIFYEIERYLRTNNTDWDGKEITLAAELIEKAKTLAFRDVENHFLRHENMYYHYFQMREKQLEILERVLPIVTSITQTVEQSLIIADFIRELRETIHPGNTAIKFLKKLDEMRKSFQEMELPQSREEFEARAALFQFLREMEQYLQIKHSYKGMD